MDATHQTPAPDVVMPSPDRVEIFDQFTTEHGDYQRWSEETRDAYVNTVRHATGFGAL